MFFKKYRQFFFNGPKDLGITVPKSQHGYQSPTVASFLWIYCWTYRYLTFTGRLILPASVVVYMYSIMTFEMPIYILSLALFCLFPVNFIIGFLTRPKLEFSRNAPKRTVARAETVIHYSIRNSGKRPIWDLAVEILPIPIWILRKERGGHIPELAPGETVNVRLKITPKQRGEFFLPAARCACSFPLHLWYWGKTNGTPHRLIVHPAFEPLTSFNFSSKANFQPRGKNSSGTAGQSMEFLGCRSYRTGDSLRHLHMRSWARTTYPVVKEFHDEFYCRSALVVDNHIPAKIRLKIMQTFRLQDQRFEACLSLGIAIINFFAEQDIAMDIFAAGKKIYRFDGGRNVTFLDSIMDVVACLQPSTEDEIISTFSSALVNEIRSFTTIVIIMIHWDEQRRIFVEDLLSRGIPCKIFLVKRSDATLIHDLPPAVQILNAEDIIAGRCHEL